MVLRQWVICLCTLAFIMGFGFGLANGKVVRKLRIRARVYPTIVVDPSGKGNFSSIQSAVDAVPSNNRNWICIYAKAGTYREQVNIPFDKPFIYLKGEGKWKTTVVWNAHDSIATSGTLISQADNFVAKSLSFVVRILTLCSCSLSLSLAHTHTHPPPPPPQPLKKNGTFNKITYFLMKEVEKTRNSFNYPMVTYDYNAIKPALAAMISGDKSAFYRCGFIGFQDTLWDVQGRHYFKLCTIQGAIDFIFGAGQSLYERCTISVAAKPLGELAGFITAQGRSNPHDPSGFVFKECNVIGSGQAFLGRPWRDHARVVFFNTSMSSVVVPEGWSAWESIGRESLITFAEHGCNGLGSNTSKRVKWEKKLKPDMLWWLTSMSYIDSEASSHKMSSQYAWCVSTCLALFFLGFGLAKKSHGTHSTIRVDQSGNGDFSTIQSAIDSIPKDNTNWIRIDIKAGVYKEQVRIPADKPYIYLKGEGSGKTEIVWGETLLHSATFTSEADNIVAESITFTNSYNYPPKSNGNPIKQALAARISGDKSSFYRCQFFGLQDTLLDDRGRHYFKNCLIQGTTDFIFGMGQSIYEKCTIATISGHVNPKLAGYITAQGRSNPNDDNGFVFKDCKVVGTGKTYLGRAWKGYARVIFYRSSFSSVVVPEGWNAWNAAGHEDQITFVEEDCRGPGSDTSRRVEWVKKLGDEALQSLTSISFIDGGDWLRNLPLNPRGHANLLPYHRESASIDWEQVTIPTDKPFIYLQGEEKGKTQIVWGDTLLKAATFTSLADNIVAENLTFTVKEKPYIFMCLHLSPSFTYTNTLMHPITQNSFNYPPEENGNPLKQALAARISGDKSSFYNCEFFGVQDTLLDDRGRHYFKLCTITGAYDFIFGAGQSLYEKCTLSVISGSVDSRVPGYITAQGRSSPNDTDGFVFKDCNVVGTGSTYLGRAWKDFARVLFYRSSLSDIIVVEGWNAWNVAGHEDQITFAEDGCYGPGSDTSKRVPWVKKLSEETVQSLTSVAFIDNEGWLNSQPLKILAS
ncbi:hypothetical protein RJ640_022256 [Escallonia rubra]|uniref:pectinesterase n=1 Tax=Escallonia rubra TaxID=112253 RepID=A0AA88UJE1_9ASTE|nr:hypothetical protein RJ640_022256 [Escallonia rubra]